MRENRALISEARATADEALQDDQYFIEVQSKSKGF